MENEFKKSLKVQLPVQEEKDEEQESSKNTYREKIFDDMLMALVKSAPKYVQSTKDASEGLLLLTNFRLIFDNFDEVLNCLVEERIKKDNMR